MSIDPKPGLVIRYDFLWNEDRQEGRDEGAKDRPCAIVVASPENTDGSRKVWLCAITHSPPEPDQTGLEIPPKVAKHLGLDHEKSWIKTHEINALTWQKGRIPPGVTQAKPGHWSFGHIPPKLGKQMFNQVRQNANARMLHRQIRDDQDWEDRTYTNRLNQQRDRFKPRPESDAHSAVRKNKNGNSQK